jgi:putative ABC transport system permease protein
MTLLVRTAGDPGQWVDELRAAVAAIDPNLPLVDVGTLSGHLAGLLSQERLAATLLGLAALLALVLAATGLYGVIAYAVSRRTRELGLRMALGARRGDVLALVLRRGMALALAGLALGLAAAFAGTRLLEGFLYGTRRTDPLTFVTVSGLLLAVALLASYLPARTAARVDPLRALRHEA